ncbi:hypothetical protein B0H17DRAFT_1331659 [Mycena rosella]|uniref:Uncharacterized protein n=1 Tax=Mycena rosella TaxID=1033263 RepID=A0AAD7GIM8_MYCRO|nr:hypothetical protein B0H17DRAFT_1331659 [Mycena rosella]
MSPPVAARIMELPSVALPVQQTARRANTAERHATHNPVECMRCETRNGRFLTLASLILPLAALRRLSKAAIVYSILFFDSAFAPFPAFIVPAPPHRPVRPELNVPHLPRTVPIMPSRVVVARPFRYASPLPSSFRHPSSPLLSFIFEVNEWRLRARVLPLAAPPRSDVHAAVLLAEVEDLDLDLALEEDTPAHVPSFLMHEFSPPRSAAHARSGSVKHQQQQQERIVLNHSLRDAQAGAQTWAPGRECRRGCGCGRVCAWEWGGVERRRRVHEGDLASGGVRAGNFDTTAINNYPHDWFLFSQPAAVAFRSAAAPVLLRECYKLLRLSTGSYSDPTGSYTVLQAPTAVYGLLRQSYELLRAPTPLYDLYAAPTSHYELLRRSYEPLPCFYKVLLGPMAALRAPTSFYAVVAPPLLRECYAVLRRCYAVTPECSRDRDLVYDATSATRSYWRSRAGPGSRVPVLPIVTLNDGAACTVLLLWTQLTSHTLEAVFPIQCAPISQQAASLVHCESILCIEPRDKTHRPDITLGRLESLVVMTL